ncbi:MAG: hypothetical protein QM765_16775 [Myxococcales bacterium]
MEYEALQGDEFTADAVDGTGAAFKALSFCLPDVALVDAETLWAEEQQGRTLIDALKARRVPTVLLVSDKVPAELLESAHVAGVDDAILLPLKPTAVRERIKSVLAPPPPAKARAGRVRVRLDKPSAYVSELCEQLELNGYELKVLEGESPDGEPADVTVLAWNDPMRLAKAVGLASGGSQVIVSSHPAPSMIPSGVEAWLPCGRAEMAVKEVNAHFQVRTRDLRTERRIPFFCPVEFREWGIGRNAAWSSGYSYAFSPGGLFIRTLVPTRRKVAVEMKIFLTLTGETFAATGVSVWSSPRGESRTTRRAPGMGVEFLGMPLSKRLLNLIQACREVGGT